VAQTEIIPNLMSYEGLFPLCADAKGRRAVSFPKSRGGIAYYRNEHFSRGLEDTHTWRTCDYLDP
jgi:hypothetical protein